MLNFKLTKLSNGLRVVTAPLENTKAVTILILVGTGSRYETAEENGIAHFLEHMFFKGTKKRPQTVDIARALDSVGASYNAFTGEEYTGYFVRVSSNHFELGLDVLTDMLYGSLFSAEEIEKEKGVIFEEINMIKDMPQNYIEYVLKELLWQGQPLGRTITGERETVANFNRNTFVNFKEKYYRPENMVVVVSGGQNHKNWLEKIEEVFASKENIAIAKPQAAKNAQSEPQLKIHHKKTDQAHFALGFRSLKQTDAKKPVLQVLNNIMGATMSSRLFIEVRERRGLCYYVSTDAAYYADAGFWGASAGVDINRIEEAVKVILEQFAKLKTELVADEELNRAKENLKGRLYLKLEESLNVAEFLAEQELLESKLQDPDKVVEEYQKVTKEDIMELAKQIFRPENLNLAIIGPFEEKEKFVKLLKEFK